MVSKVGTIGNPEEGRSKHYDPPTRETRKEAQLKRARDQQTIHDPVGIGRQPLAAVDEPH